MGTRTEKRRRQNAKRAAERPAPESEVNTFAQAQGDYRRDGNRGVVNRGGTPVARWRNANLLTETQSLAIDHCIKLWDRAGRHTGLVQDLLKIVGQQPSSGWSQQEALDELAWLKERIPFKAWNVFENVCRFDMPAGTAGSTLATNSRSAIDAARVAVCFVADLIAMWKRL